MLLPSTRNEGVQERYAVRDAGDQQLDHAQQQDGSHLERKCEPYKRGLEDYSSAETKPVWQAAHSDGSPSLTLVPPTLQ